MTAGCSSYCQLKDISAAEKPLPAVSIHFKVAMQVTVTYGQEVFGNLQSELWPIWRGVWTPLQLCNSATLVFWCFGALGSKITELFLVECSFAVLESKVAKWFQLTDFKACWTKSNGRSDRKNENWKVEFTYGHSQTLCGAWRQDEWREGLYTTCRYGKKVSMEKM